MIFRTIAFTLGGAGRRAESVPRPTGEGTRTGFGAVWLALLIPAVAAGCGGELSEDWREAAAEGARAESLAVAEASFDPAAYDTIRWSSDFARAERGSVVWESSCAKCHGADGAGGGELAVEHDLHVPSFVEAGWLYAGDVPQIRYRTFVGHGATMPSWGLHELSPRDVDAVAFFILERLQDP